MNTPKPPILRFIVLIPHRDRAKLLADYSRRLFAAGFPGARSFPAAAPLALVSRPFTAAELRDLALGLRELTLAGGREGKITALGAAGVVRCPGTDAGTGTAAGLSGELSFFGPALDLPLEGAAGAKLFETEGVLCRFTRPVICAALLGAGDEPPGEEHPAQFPAALAPPPFFFRAASVANLVIRPLSQGDGDYSFEWKTGKPVWLPAYRPPRKRQPPGREDD